MTAVTDPPVLVEDGEQDLDGSGTAGERLRVIASTLGSAAFLAILAAGAWELIKLLTGTDDIKMPHIWSILAYFGTTTSQGENYSLFLLRNVWSTAQASLIGLALGVVFGMATGVLIARSRLIGYGLTPLVVAAQAVP